MEAIVPTGYKKTKVGIIPTDWNLYRIDEVLTRVRKPLEVKPDENYQEIGIRSHGKGLFYKEFTTIDEIGNKLVFWIEPDCFIVNIVFAWEQAIGKTTSNEIGMIASHRFPMYKPQKKVLDLDYLVYLFKSKRGKYLLELASPGGAGRNKTLGQGEFAELQIPVPPFNEQVKIAQILTTWDEAINKQEVLIKEKEHLKKGLIQKLLNGEAHAEQWKAIKLKDILFEHGTKSNGKCEVHSVSVSKGLINQIEHLGRSYAAEDTSNYNLVKPYDIVYTKSPTGDFPYGIVKQNMNNYNAIVSPLYGVFSPKNQFLGHLLHLYFESPQRTINYLNPIIQKGAKNTINITNTTFLSKQVFLPTDEKEQMKISNLFHLIDDEIIQLKIYLEELKKQKKGLMQKLLTGKVRVKI